MQDRVNKLHCFILVTIMEGTNVVVKEVKILETADDIQDRRDQVLSRYTQFRTAARVKRDKLEDSRKFQVKCL